MTRSAGEPSIHRQQRSFQGFRERHIERVINGQVVSQLPGAVQKRRMTMPHQPEGEEVVQGLPGPGCIDRAGQVETT
jgi:hypothetical protein